MLDAWLETDGSLSAAFDDRPLDAALEFVETLSESEDAMLDARTAFESAVEAAADVAEFCDFTAPFTSKKVKP